MQQAGRTVDPADWPPALDWETPVWELFSQRLATQWRTGFGGRIGLDYNVAVGLAERRGWDVERVLDLLGAIEAEILEWDANEREKRRQA